ncbi:Pre-mRNA-processing protein PRP40 [Pseudozyma hubeiensis]|nr:Pre-mRNA-processing protein PRP40 [Pseudozyma hubeiensis]
MSAPGAPWTEHRTPEGRPYWYHTMERRSVWEKPSELKTPRERALEATPWKEYKSGDRSYYVHNVTKESTWTLPAELKQILEQYPVDDDAATAPSPAVASPHVGGATQSPAMARSPVASQSPYPMGQTSPRHNAGASSARGPDLNSPNPLQHRGVDQASGSNTPLTQPSNASRAPTSAHQTMSGSAEINFKGDKEAAEAAFIQLLRETGVDVDWTWETTMRTIITNPLYKALKTIAERKAAFNKHIDALRQQRATEAAARMESLRPAFKQLLTNDSRIKSYSSFATAKKFLSTTAVWKQAQSEEEARQVFEAVMKDLQQTEREEEAKLKDRNREMLMALLKTFEADVFTRWRDAHRTILESQEYIDDPHLPSMDLSDMLVVFEELIRGIEKEADASRRRELEGKRRKERQNRDEFKLVLRRLKEGGKIVARSTWGEVYPLIKDDDAFLRVAGQSGSTPLELFYDLVDELDQELERQTADALQHISKLGQEVTPTTTAEDFLTWTTDVDVPLPTLKQIHAELVSFLAAEEQRAATEARKKLERKFRHQIEDLRYAFKKCDPPLDLDADWQTVTQRMHDKEEWKQAEREDERVPRWAWDKFVRRQREKELESEGRKRKDLPARTKAEETKEAAPIKRARRDDDESEPEEGEV